MAHRRPATVVPHQGRGRVEPRRDPGEAAMWRTSSQSCASCSPRCSSLLLADAGADGWFRSPPRVSSSSRSRPTGSTDARAAPQSGHRSRQPSRPHRRQGAHRRRLVVLAILGELPWWVTIVILVRELGITVLRFVCCATSVIPASLGGKLKTVVQSVAISFALVPLRACSGDWIQWSTRAHVRRRRRDRGERGSSTCGRPGAPATTRPPSAGDRGPRRGVIAALVERGLTIAVAESLTGGLLVAELISHPGRLGRRRGGIVAYATELKHPARRRRDPARRAGPRAPGDGDADGAGRARATIDRAADLGVATTGVAGPDAQGGHPVGTRLCRGRADARGRECRELRLGGDRPTIGASLSRRHAR